jgi:hypothetical protein
LLLLAAIAMELRGMFVPGFRNQLSPRQYIQVAVGSCSIDLSGEARTYS